MCGQMGDNTRRAIMSDSSNRRPWRWPLLACVTLTAAGCGREAVTTLSDSSVSARDATLSTDAAPRDAAIDAGATRDSGPSIDATVRDAMVVPDTGVSCRSLDEAQCSMNMACRADYCPGCPTRRFVQCAEPGEGPPPCPPPVPCPCNMLDEPSCELSPDCHPVFVSQQACACPQPGCCTTFDRCVDGGRVDCAGENLSCRRVAPYCEAPYVISYQGTCYEGCARPGACAASAVQCASTARAPFPHFAKRCTTERDCAIGTHQIDCCGSTAAIGISSFERRRFEMAEGTCRTQYPACGCPAQPTIAEDGQFVLDPARLVVQCINTFCTTSVR